jgi:16S rRNA (uracil1498-N3)-methyltransferase
MRSVRVYVDAPLGERARVRLPPFAADHLVRVLRLPDGAAVVCFNGDGLDHAATLEISARGVVELRVGTAVEVRRESPLAITLVQSIARGERMDLILQKATELGVARIIPISSERTEVRLDEERAERRVAHWQRVVQSACEQCGRARVPVVAAPVGLAAHAAGVRELAIDKRVLQPDASDGPAALGPCTALMLAAGPEGGFSERDLALFAQAGYRGLRLGPRILRTETAGLAAIAALQSRFGDLG